MKTLRNLALNLQRRQSSKFAPFMGLLLGRLVTLNDNEESIMMRRKLQAIKNEAIETNSTLYLVKNLRKLLEELIAEPIAVKKTETVQHEDGCTSNLQAQNWIFALLAHLLCDVLKAKPAPNYVECSFEYTELGPITLHIQKRLGKTPHQLRLEAEAERDELKRSVINYLEMLDYSESRNLSPDEICNSNKLNELLGDLKTLSGYVSSFEIQSADAADPS